MNIRPVVDAPRRIPVALRERVIKELKRMEQMRVIAKQTEPTDCVNGMVMVVTSNKIHMDPRDLNKAIKKKVKPG